ARRATRRRRASRARRWRAARGRAPARRVDRRARRGPRGRARVRAERPRVPERRAAQRGARGPDLRSGEQGTLMLLERTDTLAAIGAKVEAGKRLDFDDGVALMESDDLLGLGE